MGPSRRPGTPGFPFFLRRPGFGADEESNAGQGLGFVLWGTGTVVNRRLILSGFLKLVMASSVFLGVAKTLSQIQSDLKQQLYSGATPG